jgi:hypothetical protein
VTPSVQTVKLLRDDVHRGVGDIGKRFDQGHKRTLPRWGPVGNRFCKCILLRLYGTYTEQLIYQLSHLHRRIVLPILPIALRMLRFRIGAATPNATQTPPQRHPKRKTAADRPPF